ncbi:MAG: HAD-IA family hydrolase [Hyphomonadaceae bacterium]
MIKAVIFDFGGVFTTSPFDSFNEYEAKNNLPRDFIRGLNATNPDTNAWARFERNEINAAEFDRIFYEESGARVPGAHVMSLIYGALRPNMVAALAACKRRYKTGCITNNVATDRPNPAKMQAVFDMFDHVIESSKAGLRKPDPRIYEMMCSHLGVDPGACIYLDDLGVNLKPARALGMATIKVLGEAQALAELAALTGIPPEEFVAA